MTRVLQRLTIIALLLCIGSCTRHQMLYSTTPKPSQQNKNSSHSQKVISTNWQKIATTLADTINNTLIQKDYADKSVYLSLEKSTATPFDESFHKILTAALLTKGVPVKSSPGLNSLTIICESQLLLTSKVGFWSRSRQGTLLLTASIIFEKRYIFSRSQLFAVGDDELAFFTAPSPGETIEIAKKEALTSKVSRKIIIQKSDQEITPVNPKPIL